MTPTNTAHTLLRRGRTPRGAWRLLHELRAAKSLTQTQLGDLVGVGQALVSEWETLARPPEWRYLGALGKALDVHPRVLAADIAENFLP